MNLLQNKAIAAIMAMFGAQSFEPTLPGKHHKGDIQQKKGKSEAAHLSKKELKKRKRQRKQHR